MAYSGCIRVRISYLAFTELRIAHGKGVAQHFIQRNTLVCKERMPCRYNHHQRVTARRLSNNAFTHFDRLGKSRIVEIVVQASELL